MSDRGRSERRREDRLRMGVSSGGAIYHPEDMPERMPVKEPRRHRWCTIATFTLTDQEAAAAAEGMKVVSGPANLVSYHIGCIDCEKEYEEARLHPCPAGDEWYPPSHPNHREMP